MNFLSTGVKEITRRLRRQKNRLALANARKVVDKAEIALGRHGWRWMADDEAVRSAYETLVRLDADVTAADKHIEELEGRVRDQEAVREQARREHQEQLDRLEVERKPVLDELHAVQARLAEHTKALQEQNAKKTALKVEQTALLKDERRARRRSASDEECVQIQSGLDARRGTLAEQAAQLAVARSGVTELMAGDQEAIKDVRGRLHALDQRVHEARAALAMRERAATVAIAELNKEIAATRRQAARVEEEKNPALLVIGRRLSEIAASPDGAEDLITNSRRHRESFDRLSQLEAAWLQESQDANKQDLRLFNFVWTTFALLLAFSLLLVFRSPGKRDWLPSNTEAILTVDVSRFTEADFTRALQSDSPDTWRAVWGGLVRTVADVPEIDVRRQVAHITRALAPGRSGQGPPADYMLVEMRPSVDVDALVRHNLGGPGGFEAKQVHGLPLPIYRKGDVAVAQIGPDTLALGSPDSVETLVRVRLGLLEDLKSDAQFFSEFQRLDDGSAFRLVTYRPSELTPLTDPLLNSQLVGDCRAVGLTLDMHEPVSAVFLLNTSSPEAATQVARLIQSNPDQVLQLASAGPNLFMEPPTVRTHEAQIEWRFRMTRPAAREFLQRVTRLGQAMSEDPAVARSEAPAAGR